jgi:hypothetical protein
MTSDPTAVVILIVLTLTAFPVDIAEPRRRHVEESGVSDVSLHT